MLGLAFGDDIELLLGNAVVVAWALIIGGVAILVVERLAKPDRLRRRRRMSRSGIRSVIGLVQCLAMIPGVSRSGATILGAMAMGSTARPPPSSASSSPCRRLTGATALQLFKHGDQIPSRRSSAGSGSAAWFRSSSRSIVVKAFMSIITRFGFAPFAWYRIVAGAAALVWLAAR